MATQAALGMSQAVSADEWAEASMDGDGEEYVTGKHDPEFWSSGYPYATQYAIVVLSHLARQKDFALWEGMSQAWKDVHELSRRSEFT